VVITPVVFNSAVLALNLDCASGSIGGAFPMECRPPPKPPDHWPERSRGSNAGCDFVVLGAAADWAAIPGANAGATANAAIKIVMDFRKIIGTSIMAPLQQNIKVLRALL
jgi:hypothetical protein